MHPFLLIPTVAFGFLAGRASTPKKLGPLGHPLIAWQRFVTIMAVAPKSTISDKGKLGAFQMDARRLRDVGAMKSAVKGHRDGKTGIWVGEWEAPLTEKEFLGNLPLQYATFCRSMRDAAPKVSGYVGCEIDGKKATLSGLLGVSHAAGTGGVESWVKDKNIRQRFKGTTKTFHDVNGIF